MKKLFTLVLILLGVQMYSLGGGFFYPKIVFSFELLNPHCIYGAEQCLKEASSDSLEILFFFRQQGNNFEKIFQPIFLTRKPYKTVRIIDLSYQTSEKVGSFLKDAVFKITNDVVPVGSQNEGYVTIDGSYYWLNGLLAKAENNKKNWPEVNFEKIFNNKRPGDVFPFTLIVHYQFDEDEIKKLELNYHVKVLKGRYISPFAGW